MADAGNAILVGVLTTALGIAAVEISRKVANHVIGDPHDMEIQKFEMMHRRLEGHDFYIPPASEGGEAPRASRPKTRNVGKVAGDVNSPVMEHVRGALHHLEAVKDTTKCPVCLKGVNAAIDAVKRESQVIVRADSKYNVMQQLKAAGKIPEGARWDMLNPKQKKFINNVVERSVENGI